MRIRNFIFISVFCINTVFVSGQQNDFFKDVRDGHVYPAVIIGKQVWMGTNLAWLPSVNRLSDSQFDTPCYYVYAFDATDTTLALKSDYFSRYGTLYNYPAAKSACPPGWHLPSDEEWRVLEEYLGMSGKESGAREWRGSGKIGLKVKAVKGYNNVGGSNESGLGLLPGGCRGYGGCESEGFCGYFWTSSPAGGDNAWRRGFCSDDDGSCRQEDRRYFGCSVRCLKDQ
ncbi:MAG: FISUMP domain-containing protein [Bacteroidales bacterium]|jgi:uncharacterized protein (TIGR02145 family)